MNKHLKSLVVATIFGTMLAVSFVVIADTPDTPDAGTRCSGYSKLQCKNYIAKFPDERAAIGAGANSVKFDSQPNTCWNLGIIYF